MAMYISAEPNQHAVWHVGEPTNNSRLWNAAKVFIQADGDELNYIKNNFTGIRMCNNKRVVRWQGEDALFIAQNMYNASSVSTK